MGGRAGEDGMREFETRGEEMETKGDENEGYKAR